MMGRISGAVVQHQFQGGDSVMHQISLEFCLNLFTKNNEIIGLKLLGERDLRGYRGGAQ